MTDAKGDARSGRADFWTGLALATVGLGFAVESLRMPRLSERGINPMTAPGIVPGVLGGALFILGLVLALRRHDPARGRTGLTAIIGTGSGRLNLAIAVSLNLVFALVLVGRLPFWLATFLYLSAFMCMFGLQRRRGAWGKRAALILVVGAAVTASVVLLFESLFLVRLP